MGDSAEAPLPAQRIRLLSFNVNGLRALLSQRLKLTMKQFLESLNADIVCLQETKLRRSDIDRDVAVVDGWDAFLSCDCQSRTGYSGTATYVRTDVALPFAAEEGFTGCSGMGGIVSKAAGGASRSSSQGPTCMATPHPALAAEFTVEELAELDCEGRVTVTDHGAFVLFNIYGPAITSEEARAERLRFKMRFFCGLELRWRDLARRGRAVVAVGDLNISPAPIDQPDYPANVADFYRPLRPDRRWLRRLMQGRPGGLEGLGASQGAWEAATDADAAWEADVGSPEFVPAGTGNAPSGGHGSSLVLIDTFRIFHPGCQRAFTCWSTATNARVNNHGARIDLVLTAGLAVGQPPAGGAAAATSTAAGGSTGAAVRAAYVEEGRPQGQAGSGPDGTAGLAAAAAATSVWCCGGDIWPEQQGSDHCPVWADFECAGGGAFPCATAAPSTAMRFAFKGSQLKLHSFLQRGLAAATSQPDAAAATATGAGTQPSCAAEARSHVAPRQGGSATLQQHAQPPAAGSSAASAAIAAGPGSPRASGHVPASTGAGPSKKQATLKSLFHKKQQGTQPLSQQHASSAGFSQSQGMSGPSTQQQQQQQLPQQPQPSPGAREQQRQQQPEPGTNTDGSFIAAELAAASVSRQQSAAAAKDVWRGLQQRYQVPKCIHREPAVLKKVGKTGPNRGRYFYTCARPDGPAPHGKCDFFKWVERRPTDHQLTTLGINMAGSGGGGSGDLGAGPPKRMKA